MTALLLLWARYKLIIEIGLFVAAAIWFIDYEQGVGEARVQAKWDKQVATDKEEARKKEQYWTTQNEIANKNGAAREKTIHDLTAANNVAVGSLRDTVAQIRSGVPTATVDSLGKSVTALSTVFTECVGRYQGLAEKADRHANDTSTLIEKWPKDVPAVDTK